MISIPPSVSSPREGRTTQLRMGMMRSLTKLSLSFHLRLVRVQVLYTYLNVPFLQLKQQSLLQQAKLAGERLEREVRELEGFIGGHSYENYMKHLQSTNVDPTAGLIAPPRG